MKYYKVVFSFEIPVAVKDGDDNEAKIDAYYEARSEFPNFSVNESTVTIDAIGEQEYREMRSTVNSLHKDKA